MLLVAHAFAADLAIRHATLLPISGPAIPDSTVVIYRGKIVQVGGAVPAGTPEVDATGAWLMPGMIDMHSHMGV